MSNEYQILKDFIISNYKKDIYDWKNSTYTNGVYMNFK